MTEMATEQPDDNKIDVKAKIEVTPASEDGPGEVVITLTTDDKVEIHLTFPNGDEYDPDERAQTIQDLLEVSSQAFLGALDYLNDALEEVKP